MADQKLIDLTSASSTNTTDLLYLSQTANDRKITLETLCQNIPDALIISAPSEEGVEVQSTSPTYIWYESNGAANEKYWRMIASSGDLIFQTQNDAKDATDEIFRVRRTANVVDEVDFDNKVVISNGGLDINDGDILIENSSGNARLQIDAGTDDDAQIIIRENGSNKWLNSYDSSSDKILWFSYTLGSTVFEIADSSGDATFAANCDALTYSVNGTAGVDFSGAVSNITVIKGLVTAAS